MEPYHEKELHIAPMLAVSYPEFRYFIRLLSKRAILWTEMVVDETINYCSPEQMRNRHLYADLEVEPPVVVQLGGNRSDYMSYAVKCILNQSGVRGNLDREAKETEETPVPVFGEINLNAECPSTLVATKNQFGAALMLDIDVAVRVLKALKEAAGGQLPVSIKTRIAVDDQDGWDDYLLPYITRLRDEAGCRRFYMHARKVYTKGLSPMQNRAIPPLDYSLVYKLCETFPDCDFWLNGGLRSLKHAKEVCYGVQRETYEQHGVLPCQSCNANHGSCVAPPPFPAPSNLRGCLVGRLAQDDPAKIARTDTDFYNEPCNPSHNRREALERYVAYLEERFPRRCRDSSEAITRQWPSPAIPPEEQDVYYCPRCSPLEEKDMKPLRPNSTNKIHSRLLGLCFRPINGLFYEVSGSRPWRQALHEWMRDPTKWDCGPAFALRQVMSMKCLQEPLDMPF